MIREAIILAGGRGTRLRSIVSDIPKPMALVAGSPFLLFLLEYLIDNDIKRVILSVGYKYENIVNYFGNRYKNLDIDYAIETYPLGTGGAIKNALKKVKTSDVLVLNGDTYSKISVNKLYFLYCNISPDIAILIRPSNYTDRYDTINIGEKYCIIKTENVQPYINSGLYIINTSWFLSKFNGLDSFSFEEKLFRSNNRFNMIGVPDNNYFVDIGIPEDYKKSNVELDDNKFIPINRKTDTLFLDRDGVINKKNDNGYVMNWNNFVFLLDIKNVINNLSIIFRKIVIVTNQQCIGKGLITYEDVYKIHKRMLKELDIKDSKINIYLCPHRIKDNCECRKPKTGLFINAKNNDHDIEFDRSIMIGDSATDILSAKKLNITSVYLTNGLPPEIISTTNCDYIYQNLYEYSNNIL